jgi:hypothetical protein
MQIKEEETYFYVLGTSAGALVLLDSWQAAPGGPAEAAGGPADQGAGVHLWALDVQVPA